MISRERIVAALNVDPVVNVDDLIEAAIAFIEAETSRYFSLPVENIDYLSGHDIRNLRLLSLPYSGASPLITAVTEQKPGADATVLTTTDYELRQRGHVAWLTRTGSDVWRAGHEYVVTYTHGYDKDGLPRDIEQLILTLIQRRLGTFETGGLKSETYDRVTLTRFGVGDLVGLDGVDSIVSQWKVPVFA